MRYLVNSREMQQLDKHTTEVWKVPSLILMEQAALACAAEIEKRAEKENTILIVCGTGNNGGDGLAVGRLLYLHGCQVELVLIGEKEKASAQNRKQQEILTAYGVSIAEAVPADKTYDIVIDALFGVGLSREVGGTYKTAIEAMNRLKGYKIAIDVPSGLSADNGAILGVCFRADLTLTFAFDKIGLHLWPGNEKTGDVLVKEIGITEKSFLEEKPRVRAVEACDLKRLVIRPSHSNKGTYGKLLIIAGSVNMAGAAVLAAKSAYAAGCGLVRIFTPEENRIVIQTAVPEAILTTYSAEKAEEAVLKDALSWADAVLCGPGLGLSDTAEAIVLQVLKEAAVPVVLDADALNLLAKNPRLLKVTHTELILTPHLGEMSRLTGVPVGQIQTQLLDIAGDFAKAYDVICVLKDERTVTAVPDGALYLNLSGNSGMATAGSGDVLAGVLGSLLAQGLSGKEAAPLGVYLHGAAGDFEIKTIGKAGLMASDISEGIRQVLAGVEQLIK